MTKYQQIHPDIYTTYCAANVYIFVYIFIGTPIVPLKTKWLSWGTVFCSDKSQETFENLQKATKALEKLQNANGKFLSLGLKTCVKHSMEQHLAD